VQADPQRRASFVVHSAIASFYHKSFPALGSASQGVRQKQTKQCRYMIIEDYTENIEAFSELRLRKLNSINMITGENNILFKKILYLTFLDSISTIVYPNESNKVRFVKLMNRFSMWEDKDRVSLPHLGKMLSLSPDPSLNKLREFVTNNLKEWKDPEDTSIFSRKDLLVSNEPKWEVINKLVKGSDTKVLNTQLSEFKHSNLLYQLRNSLVHQFQSRGDESGNNHPKEPYYMVLSKSSSFFTNAPLTAKPIRFILVYPTYFLEKLTHSTFNNVMEYLKQNNINPFPHFYAGDYWIDVLN